LAKNLKLKIKNTQLAKAVNLGKPKLSPKPEEAVEVKEVKVPEVVQKEEEILAEDSLQPEKRRIRAKKRSAFAPPEEGEQAPQEEEAQAPVVELAPIEEIVEEIVPPSPPPVVAETKIEEPPRAEPLLPKEEKVSTPAVEVTPVVKAPATTQEEEAPKKRKIDLSALPPKARGGFKAKQFKDVVKPKRTDTPRFDSRDRQGLRASDDDSHWKKRRPRKVILQREDTTIRPTSLSVRLPIPVKDLAASMKLKASQLISKLFMQGVVVTLNDLLDDETTIQLLGHEFGCNIAIDTSEEERLRITDKTIREEIQASDKDKLAIRPPVIAFMGHVDHGKTSLIDSIRASNRVAGEAGAITQHIGAFQVQTEVGKIAILDTPGHEAFTAMRARGAEVTDIVVLVIAGDEGIRAQTVEAIQHAKAAGVTILVAANKCDKPNFNIENVYRELADQDLLPEEWGGKTIVVRCSAVTGEGVPQLLEMAALQAEVLELRANPSARARGSVLESEMHKGLGVVATVLVQNGTLRPGDSLVFEDQWGRVKTMRDEHGQDLLEAGPSTPISITGLSGLPQAGQEFIVVENERVAKEIIEGRREGQELRPIQKRRQSMESLLAEAQNGEKKVLNLILRADVQGSLEALKASLMKIESDKAELLVIFSGIGAVSESDAELAVASNAVILAFHTQVESHAEQLIRQSKVMVRQHNVIYHAIDDIKDLMTGRLDKVAQEVERGAAEVRATFKAGHRIIAGCIITEGAVGRNDRVRLLRGGEKIWEGTIASLRRDQDDAREVKKGLECGILFDGFNAPEVGDRIEAFEITYVAQEL
jgi:translation initiation factor IF-2